MNVVTFEGEGVEELLDNLKDYAETANGLKEVALSFNKVIDMPLDIADTNTCANEDLAVKIVRHAQENNLSIKEATLELINEVMNTNISSKDHSVHHYLNLIQKYGKCNWYDWSIENWGTKWDACDPIREGNTLYFATAWSHPLPIIRHLAKQNPEIDIHVMFADEDYGNNFGEYEIKNEEFINLCNIQAGTDEAVKFSCEVWNDDYDKLMREWEQCNEE